MRCKGTLGVCFVLALAACGSDSSEPAAGGHTNTGGSGAASGGADSGGVAGTGGETAGAAGVAGQGGSGASTGGAAGGAAGATAGQAGSAGQGGNSAGSGGGASGTGGATGDPGVVVPDALADRLMGQYAMRAVVSSLANAPMIGQLTLTSRAYGLATIERDGQGLRLLEQGCHVDMESSNTIVNMQLPDAIAQSMPPNPTPLRAWEEGAVVKFNRPESVLVVGANLADPIHDALPTDQTDPRVIDQDGDGKPGVTILFSGFVSGQLYAVQRQRASYDGTISANDTFTGTNTDRSEQSVLGASNPLLEQPLDQTPNPDSSLSTILLVKVSGSYDCSKLMADKDTLFAP